MIAWTRVHAIIRSNTCAKRSLSDEDRTTYLAPRGNSRTSRSASNRKLYRTIVILCDLGASRERIWTVHSTFEDWTVDRASRRTTIDARLWPDRRTIVARFVRDHGAFKAKMERKHRRIKGASIFSLIDVRSGHDRGLSRAIAAKIVARKKQKSCQKLWPIRGNSWSYDVAPRKRSHDPCKPPPRPPSWPSKSGQFPSLKTHVLLLLFFNI